MKRVQCHELFGGIALLNHALLLYCFLPLNNVCFPLNVSLHAHMIVCMHVSKLNARMYAKYTE